jgi:hypothetical protein
MVYEQLDAVAKGAHIRQFAIVEFVQDVDGLTLAAPGLIAVEPHMQHVSSPHLRPAASIEI